MNHLFLFVMKMVCLTPLGVFFVLKFFEFNLLRFLVLAKPRPHRVSLE